MRAHLAQHFAMADAGNPTMLPHRVVENAAAEDGFAAEQGEFAMFAAKKFHSTQRIRQSFALTKGTGEQDSQFPRAVQEFGIVCWRRAIWNDGDFARVQAIRPASIW